MKKNRILTESKKKQIIDDKQKNIIENFANVFNKIKRLNENELSNELPPDLVEYIFNTIKTKSDDIQGGMTFNYGKLKTIFDEAIQIQGGGSYPDFKYDFNIIIDNKEEELFYVIIVSVDFQLTIYPGDDGDNITPGYADDVEISDIKMTNIKITIEDYDAEPIQTFKTTNDGLINLIGDEIEEILHLMGNEGLIFDTDEDYRDY